VGTTHSHKLMTTLGMYTCTYDKGGPSTVFHGSTPGRSSPSPIGGVTQRAALLYGSHHPPAIHRRPSLVAVALRDSDSSFISFVIVRRQRQLFDCWIFSLTEKNEVFLFVPPCVVRGVVGLSCGPGICLGSTPPRRFPDDSVRGATQDCGYGILVEFVCCLLFYPLLCGLWRFLGFVLFWFPNP